MSEPMVSQPIVTRKEAKALGLFCYATGKACKNGHISGRRTDNGQCLECKSVLATSDATKVLQKKWREDNREALLERKRKYRKDNIDAVRGRDRDWYQANKEAHNEYGRQWYKANRDIALEKAKEWALANPEAVLESKRRWRENNPEASRECTRNWERANREAARAKCRNREARKASAGGTHTARDIGLLYEQQNGMCNACTAPFSEIRHEVDHIVPLAKRGRNDLGNLQLLCPTCNYSKGVKDWGDWLEEKKACLNQKRMHWAEWRASRDAAF